MKRKTFLSLLLAAVMFLTLAPITALAAGTTNVWVDNTLLTDWGKQRGRRYGYAE